MTKNQSIIRRKTILEISSTTEELHREINNHMSALKRINELSENDRRKRCDHRIHFISMKRPNGKANPEEDFSMDQRSRYTRKQNWETSTRRRK
jgi:hypothetical protein